MEARTIMYIGSKKTIRDTQKQLRIRERERQREREKWAYQNKPRDPFVYFRFLNIETKSRTFVNTINCKWKFMLYNYILSFVIILIVIFAKQKKKTKLIKLAPMDWARKSPLVRNDLTLEIFGMQKQCQKLISLFVRMFPFAFEIFLYP